MYVITINLINTYRELSGDGKEHAGHLHETATIPVL